MKNKILWLVTALIISSANMMAFDKKALNDTLNTIAQRQASVGSVKVKQVKVTNGHVVVKTNSSLGYLSISPNLLDSLEGAVRAITKESGSVTIYSDDDNLRDLVTSLHLTKAQQACKKRHTLHVDAPLTQNTSRAYAIKKGLEGKHIALYGSHGLYYHQPQERWLWQRARMFTTVEDLYTTSYVMPFLVPMLENAGAVVIQARERDRQTEEVIVDETDAVHSGWTIVGKDGWGEIPDGVLYEGENPFTFGGYAQQTMSNNEGHIIYIPELTKEGEYAVYVSYKTLKNSTNKAVYSIVHKGIKTTYHVNQRMGGSTWVYLGTFSFGTEAAENYVSVSSKGRSGEIVTSDAVRFGGGMGNVARYATSEWIQNVPSAQEKGQSKKKDLKPGEGHSFPARADVQDIAETSGVPRWIEGSRYWFQYTGIPDSVYNYTGSKNDYTDDYASRGRWMNYLIGGSEAYPKGPGLGIPVEMGLAFHTDAGTTLDDETIGTLVIYTGYDDDREKTYPTGASRSLARDFGDYLQTQMVEDARALFAPEWKRRRLHNSSYAEARNPKIPCVLLEFLSHQNFADMKYGLDPTFRFVMSRSIYKAMLRFNHEQYGTPYVVQPLPVQAFAARFEGDNQVVLTWKAREDELEATATPNGYVIYTREDDKDWDNGVLVKADSAIVKIEAGIHYDYKVCAVNEGGQSFPSEILSAYKATEEKGKVLIVNAFTRVSAPDWFESKDSTYAGFIAGQYGVGYMNEVAYIGEQYEFDRSMPWISDDHSGFGASYNDQRNISPIGNTFDYPRRHGRELEKMGYSYVSTSVAAVDQFATDYALVDIVMGKQKTTTLGTIKKTIKYATYPENLRKALQEYSGNLLISGAYVGTDMQGKADQTWTSNVLHYAFNADKASKSGDIRFRKIWEGEKLAQLVMNQNELILPCENPGGLKPMGDNTQTIARYGDSGVSAGIWYEKNGQRMIILGFCLESLEDFGRTYQNAIKTILK